ncbi:MAG: SAM-dependent methyltransferase, partial [Actinomycetota bacterium]
MPSGADGLSRAAADDVRRAIAGAGGAIRFDEFVAIALYGEHGFYTRGGGRAGRRGDFLTSPEIGPLFGAVIARALDAWWEELGRPDPYIVVDAGAGPGTLARAVMAAQPRCAHALSYRAVELSAAQRAAHPPTVTSLAAMPEQRFTGVIIANELLDNLPFRLFVYDGGWREAYVAHDETRFVEQLVAPAELPPHLPTTAAHGARVAVQDGARAWVESALALLEHGHLVTIDYCTTTA